MIENDARRALAQSLDEIARSVSAATIEAEMGPMCRQSFFQLVHQGSAVTQDAVDDASRAFSTLTERLMPAAVIHRFVREACANRLLPQGRHFDLVPGFTSDEPETTARFAMSSSPA